MKVRDVIKTIEKRQAGSMCGHQETMGYSVTPMVAPLSFRVGWEMMFDLALIVPFYGKLI